MAKESRAADWFKNDARATIAVNHRMAPLAFAAWTALRAHAWLLGGTLPNDDLDLQRLSGLDRRQWLSCRNKVLREFVLSDDAGRYIVRDLAAQVEELKQTLEKRVKAGQASAQARVEAAKSQAVLAALNEHQAAGERMAGNERRSSPNQLKNNDTSAAHVATPVGGPPTSLTMLRNTAQQEHATTPNQLKYNETPATDVCVDIRNKSFAKAKQPPLPPLNASDPSPSPGLLPAPARTLLSPSQLKEFLEALATAGIASSSDADQQIFLHWKEQGYDHEVDVMTVINSWSRRGLSASSLVDFTPDIDDNYRYRQGIAYLGDF